MNPNRPQKPTGQGSGFHPRGLFADFGVDLAPIWPYRGWIFGSGQAIRRAEATPEARLIPTIVWADPG